MSTFFIVTLLDIFHSLDHSFSYDISAIVSMQCIYIYIYLKNIIKVLDSFYIEDRMKFGISLVSTVKDWTVIRLLYRSCFFSTIITAIRSQNPQ